MNKKYQKGLSTLEILIAMTLIVLAITAVLLLVTGGQDTSVSSQTNQEALYLAQDLLEDAKASSTVSYSSITSGPVIEVDSDGLKYQKQLTVIPESITQCGKDIKSKVWINGRPLSVELKTHLSDLETALDLGGNCDSNPPSGDWNPPATWASSNFNPGKPTGLDSLNRIVYMTGDKSPYLFIADTRNAPYGASSGLFISFDNSFDDGAQLNDIRVARFNNNTYAFVVRNTTTLQFEVINVTDMYNPVSMSKKNLTGVSGTNRQGWRLTYFDNKVFVVTKKTTGPELHIFDVSNPNNPSEIGSGYELNRTINSLAVSKKTVSGIDHFILFMAGDKNNAPLNLLDITFPTSNSFNIAELNSIQPNMPASQIGRSVYVIGNNLYFGRDKTSGQANLFVYDISNPLSSLPLLGSVNVGDDVIGISISGRFAFLAVNKANQEFQVWNSNPNSLTQICPFNFPNVIYNGIEYENDWVYVASVGNDALRILYDPD